MRGHAICFYGNKEKLSYNYPCSPILSGVLGKLFWDLQSFEALFQSIQSGLAGRLR